MSNIYRGDAVRVRGENGFSYNSTKCILLSRGQIGLPGMGVWWRWRDLPGRQQFTRVLSKKCAALVSAMGVFCIAVTILLSLSPLEDSSAVEKITTVEALVQSENSLQTSAPLRKQEGAVDKIHGKIELINN